eukprot:m.308945 g.308945  ORF g.308945 m.308945 type:complete len:639 (+) comp45112_c0_seq1:111-2027(+)
MASTHASTDVGHLGAVDVNESTLGDPTIEAIVSTVENVSADDVLRFAEATKVTAISSSQPTATVVRIHSVESSKIVAAYSQQHQQQQLPLRNNSFTSHVDVTVTGSDEPVGAISADIDDFSDVSSDEGAFDQSEFLSGADNNDVTIQLAAAGPVGVAAAAAVATTRKRRRQEDSYSFETNPSVRRRQQTRLVRKLRATIDEFCARIGQQAVVVTFLPSKSGAASTAGSSQFKVFGSPQLEEAVMRRKVVITTLLDNALQQQAPPPLPLDANLHELPPLICDGIPTPLDQMTQAQLRAFIPIMLKYSSCRPKPGWGKEELRPVWWPEGVPWQNVRSDQRPDEEKSRIPWTDALRQIIRNCYTHHGRLDLLPDMTDSSEQPSAKRRAISSSSIVTGGETAVIIHDNPSIVPGLTAQDLQRLPPNTQLIQQINPDGTISYLAVDLSDPNTAAIVAQAQAQAAQVMVTTGDVTATVAALTEVAAVSNMEGPAAAPVSDPSGDVGTQHITTEVLASSGDHTIPVSASSTTHVIHSADIVGLPSGTAVLIENATGSLSTSQAGIPIDALAHAFHHDEPAEARVEHSESSADVLVSSVPAGSQEDMTVSMSEMKEDDTTATFSGGHGHIVPQSAESIEVVTLETS